MAVDVRKAYGMVTALGTKLGERAKEEPALVAQLRSAPDLGTFRALVREKSQGRLPWAVVDGFLDEVVTEADWVQWRARLLLQMKMVASGGKPAPGHEAGKKGPAPR